MVPLRYRFCLELFDCFSRLLRVRFIHWEIFANLQFVALKDLLQKNTSFTLPHILWALQLRAHMHDNSAPSKISGLVVIYHETIFGPIALHIFDKRYAHLDASAVESDQQNFSSSMCKFVRHLQVGPLYCAQSALEIEPDFICVHLFIQQH